MSNCVAYIKDHVGGDLSFQPDLQQEVAKTMLGLLKIRKLEDYEIKSLLLVSELERKAERTSKLRAEMGDETSLGFVSLHECKKSAMLFADITDEEAEELKVFFGQLVPKQEETLEQFMSKELGLDSRELYNPDDYSTREGKLQMSVLAMFNSGNLEDFQLSPRERVPSSRVEEIARRYYENQGYVVTRESNPLTVIKDDKTLIINISSFSNIMVSVIDLPSFF